MMRNFQRTLFLVALSTTVGVGPLASTAKANETASLSPSDRPSTISSQLPNFLLPSTVPTEAPSAKPSEKPSIDIRSGWSGFSSGFSSPAASSSITLPNDDPRETPGPIPSEEPTESPSYDPTRTPSNEPTTPPSSRPSDSLSESPSALPRSRLSNDPSSLPSISPSSVSNSPSDDHQFEFDAPFRQFFTALTDDPLGVDSQQPSTDPSIIISSEQPSIQPSAMLSEAPTQQSNTKPSLQSREPSSQPSACPSSTPSSIPTATPSSNPSTSSQANDSPEPSNQPPSSSPSARPTAAPSNNPSSYETNDIPDIVLSMVPSVGPSTETPSSAPTAVVNGPGSNAEATEPNTQEVPTPAPTVQLYPPTSSGHTPPPLVPLTASNEHQTIVSIALDGIPQLLDPASNFLVEKSITEFLSEEISEMEGVSVFFLKTQVLTQKPFHDDKNSAIVLVEALVHAVAVGGDIGNSTFQNQVDKKLKEKKRTFEKHLMGALESFSNRLAGNGGQEAMNASSSNSDKDRSGTNMVILVAAISSVMIGIIVLSICCIAMARKEKEEAREMALKRSSTGFSVHTQPSMVSRSASMRDGQQRQIVTNVSNASRSKSLPRPHGATSPYSRQNNSNLQCQSMLIQPAGSYYTTSSRRSQSKKSPLECRSLPPSCDAYAMRASQITNHPPRPPVGSVYSKSSTRRGNSSSRRSMAPPLPPPPPMIEPSYSLSSSSGESENGLNVPCTSLDNAENIELVEIQGDEEGSWVGTKVAAITGGKETVQKAEMLCQHTPNDSADSIVGNTTVLNDLVLSETTSKTHDSSKAEQKRKSPHHSKPFGLNLFRKNRGRKSEKPSGGQKAVPLEPTRKEQQPVVTNQDNSSDTDTCVGQIGGEINRQRSIGASRVRAGTTAMFKSNSTPDILAGRSQINYPRDMSNGSPSLNSFANRERSTSSISNLSEGCYSLSTSGSRSVLSVESGSSNSSASDSLAAGTDDVSGRRKYSRRQFDAHLMRRRQSTMSSASDPYPVRSRTRSSTARTVLSRASTGVSASVASDYSSDTSDSERSSLPSREARDRHHDDSFLLKLKQTVSTAAYSLAMTPDQNKSESGSNSGFVRKMTMSGSMTGSGPNSHRHYGQYGQGNSTPTSSVCASDYGVPSRIHFSNGPPLHP